MSNTKFSIFPAFCRFTMFFGRLQKTLMLRFVGVVYFCSHSQTFDRGGLRSRLDCSAFQISLSQPRSQCLFSSSLSWRERTLGTRLPFSPSHKNRVWQNLRKSSQQISDSFSPIKKRHEHSTALRKLHVSMLLGNASDQNHRGLSQFS